MGARFVSSPSAGRATVVVFLAWVALLLLLLAAALFISPPHGWLIAAPR